MSWSLRRWWMDLFRAPARPPAPDPVGDEAGTPPRGGGGTGGDDPDGRPPAAPARHRYPAPPPDDPRREAHLGAVLQALAAGPLDRAALGRLVGAADWGPGRLDGVVAHGIATGVLRDGGDGTVQARYAD